MTSPDEYNPLDYQNLTRHCVDELMRRGPFELPLKQDFFGAGVYALFYKGADPFYAKICSPDAEWPIYVGKAVPPGGRKGGGKPDHLNSNQASTRGLVLSLVLSADAPTVWVWSRRGVPWRVVAGCDRVRWVA